VSEDQDDADDGTGKPKFTLAAHFDHEKPLGNPVRTRGRLEGKGASAYI
jgi:hypothetical protein